MKIIITLLLALTISTSLYSQNEKTSYYTKDFEETKLPSEASFLLKTSYTYTDSLINFTLSTFPKQKKYISGSVITNKKDISISNIFRIGSNKSIKVKNEDEIEGVAVYTLSYYHPNGKPRISVIYQRNNDPSKREKIILLYQDATGNITAQNGNGYIELENGEFSSNTLLNANDIEKGHIQNNKKHGTWTGKLLNSKYSFEEIYDNGELISGVTTDSANNKYYYNSENIYIYPTPIGGINAFRTWIGNNLVYPQQAVDEGLQGTAIATFMIEKDGSLTKIEIKKGLPYGINEAIINILEKAPKWTPGKTRGIPISVYHSLPIKLALSNM